jgi:signal transduction histidine kinase
MQAFPDVRYILVQDPQGRILSHGFTFPKEAPPDIVQRGGDLCAACHAGLSPTEVPVDLLEVPANVVLSKGQVHAYTRQGGLILEVTVPVGDGQTGSVRLGVGDTVIAREIASITRSLLWSLALCLVVGLSLALILAYILVRPIHNLVAATHRVRDGDFQARADVFSEDEIGGLSAAFNLMTESLERYRREVREKEAARVSLIGKIVQAQEEERKTVARELHDQLGQSLSNALLSIESACGECSARRAGCDQIKDNIRGLIDEVRRMAWHVRPSILDDYGLERALERYVQETAKRVSFPIDYQCGASPDARRLPSQIEVTLYRIAQEAMTNVIRHAQPAQASVILLRQDHEVSLVVEDDGRGFDMASVEKASTPALGIIGMKERAALVGGAFAMDSQPGKGTTLRVRIPLPSSGQEFPEDDAYSRVDH